MKGSRRKFVKMFMALGAGLGLVPLQKIAAKEKEEKVKMLAPDGTLVEIDKSVFDAATGSHARNTEVQSWMKKKTGLHKNG